MSTKFDLVVIGGGPAGYTGAIRAAKLGKCVALVEREKVGGTCLNRGCLPTKTLLHSANLFASRESWDEMGIMVDSVALDQNKVYARKDKIVTGLVGGIESLLKANGVTYYKAEAKIVGEHHVAMGDETLEADYILVATGSSPTKLPIKGVENALNSDDVLVKPLEAESVVIVGGGVIGIEFAFYFSALGKAVTVIEGAERILPMFSREISMQLALVLRRRGVTIYTSAKVSEISSGGVSFEVESGHGAAPADATIVAVGRRPNVEGLGLEDLGVKINRFVQVDNEFFTGIGGVYACGDVVGRVQLAHYAAASAIYAVESMFGKTHTVDLSVVPSCVYTVPEIATVGITEFDGAKCGKFMLGANGKSIVEGIGRGYVKIATDAEGIVKGAELFGCNATEIVGELALAVKNGLRSEDIAATIHAHPTVYESVAEAAEDVFGLATHKK